MKVGTDGVLLGAWAPIDHQPYSVLDIGCGTGVIALQLAQRSGAEVIDALEIDPDAHAQCVDNFEASPWNDRLFCYHAGLAEFVSEIDDQYDLIVSNPPYHEEDTVSDDMQRATARSTASMPFDLLLFAVKNFLTPEGRFAVVLPFATEEHFLQLAESFELYPEHICRVKGTDSSKIKRSLICFVSKRTSPKVTDLVIETARHQYTDAYTDLVRDFYLKM